MVSTKKVCRFCLEYVIYILKTISTRFYWLTCRKQKLVHGKHCSKSYLFWQQYLDSLDRFLSIIWCIFSWRAHKQVATSIKKSLGNSPSLRLVQKGNFLLWQQLSEGLQNIFLLRIPRYSWPVVEKRRRGTI